MLELFSHVTSEKAPDEIVALHAAEVKQKGRLSDEVRNYQDSETYVFENDPDCNNYSEFTGNNSWVGSRNRTGTHSYWLFTDQQNQGGATWGTVCNSALNVQGAEIDVNFCVDWNCPSSGIDDGETNNLGRGDSVSYFWWNDDTATKKRAAVSNPSPSNARAYIGLDHN